MSRLSSVRSAAMAACFPAFAVVLFHACRDANKATEPPLSASKGGAGRYSLRISAGSSSASGSVVSNKGGLKCTVTKSGTAVATTSGTCDQRFKVGSVVTLTATPAAGAVLASWQGCTATSDNPLACHVTMDADRVVAAVFSPPPSSFTLTVAGGASGSGTVKTPQLEINCTVTNGTASGTCSRAFPTGASVTLTATAASGNYLKAWAGGGCDAAGTGVGSGTGSCVVSMRSAQSVLVSFTTPAAVATLGVWSSPFDWQGLGIHMHLLPNGKVLTWGRMESLPAVWDPAVPGSFTSVSRPYDVFCSGHSFLGDGRLLIAGGHMGVDDLGLVNTAIFDFNSNTWTSGPNMQNGRWYPTATTLPSGEVLAISGGDTAQQRNVIPEVLSAGARRVLSTASFFLPYYPMMFVAPDGRLYAAGPNRGTYFLNTAGTGSWSGGPASFYGNRDRGSAVMYDAGKILLLGGGAPTNTAEVVDLNAGAAAAWRSVAPMSVARKHTNATLLADGTVLVTGGTNAAGFNTAPTSSAVLAAEAWNPVTEQWTTLARMSHYRVYHSAALLLPDGRLLSAGSGQPTAVGLTDDFTAEIFSPPYLFKADGTLRTRPTIAGAPTSVSYGQTFSVQSPDAASIAKITWIRLGSVTHSTNQNQRLNYLRFSAASSTSLSVTAPANANLAPPGHYMLFILKSDGTPSVAKIVRIS